MHCYVSEITANRRIIIIIILPFTRYHKIIHCDLNEEFENAGGAENRVLASLDDSGLHHRILYAVRVRRVSVTFPSLRMPVNWPPSPSREHHIIYYCNSVLLASQPSRVSVSENR